MHSVNNSEAAGAELNAIEVNKKKQKRYREIRSPLNSILRVIHQVGYSLVHYSEKYVDFSKGLGCDLSGDTPVITELRNSLLDMENIMYTFFRRGELISKMVEDLCKWKKEKLMAEDDTRIGEFGEAVCSLKLQVEPLEAKVNSLEAGFHKIETHLFHEKDLLSAVMEVRLLFESCKPIATCLQSCLDSSKKVLKQGDPKISDFEIALKNINSCMKLMSDRFDKRKSDLPFVDEPSCVLMDTTTASQGASQAEVHRM